QERTPTPSTSSPSSSNPHTRGISDTNIYLPTSAMRVRYKTEFYSRSMLLGKDYDIDGLNQWHDFNGALSATGLITLMNLPNNTCIDLVRLFYSNATMNDVREEDNVVPWVDTGCQTRSSITTYIFSCVIHITLNYLNGLFHQTNGAISYVKIGI